MIGLPQSTAFNKRIPKKKFYENLQVSTALKKSFVEQINNIYWRNKIAPSTTNLAPGKTVDEIEIIEIQLNQKQLDENVLRQIDKEIPYHIIYVLEYSGKFQLCTAYKEATQAGKNAFKVGTYYYTAWQDDLGIKLDGLNIDAVYENLVRYIAGGRLEQVPSGDNQETLQESVGRDEERKRIEIEIERLSLKLKKEKQFNKQIQYNNLIKELNKKLLNI